MRKRIHALLALLLSLVLTLQCLPFQVVAQEIEVQQSQQLEQPQQSFEESTVEVVDESPHEEVVDAQQEVLVDSALEKGMAQEEASLQNSAVPDVITQTSSGEESEEGFALRTQSSGDDAEQLRDTFTLTSATYNNHQRATTVHFVDSQGNKLNGLVPANTVYELGEPVDFMGTYGEKLDPEIASLYDLSRVYVKLSNEQKNFRYMELNSARVVGDNSSDYRIFLYMTGINQCRAGGEFRGTWYTLNSNGATNDVYIVFDRVANPSFYAVESTSSNPVVGAEFTLYTDENCYTAFTYKDRVVKAVSGDDGKVSFGKIPFGTYYMKETKVPAGYKDEGIIRTLVIDKAHETELDNVVHVDADGSTILSSIKKTTFKVKWQTSSIHDNISSVTVNFSSQGVSKRDVVINESSGWETTIEGLDHRLSYVISETMIDEQAIAATDWVPTIQKEESVETEETAYYQVTDFREGMCYVLVAGDKALSGSGAGLGLTGGVSTARETIENYDGSSMDADRKITSAVDEGMTWTATKVTADGVITLKNDATGKYLNLVRNTWTLDANPSIKVRRTLTSNEQSPNTNLYFRENMNYAAATYLSIDGDSIVASLSEPSNPDDTVNPRLFGIYQETTVLTETVTITNRHTTYDVRIRNMAHPSGEPVAGMRYTLQKGNDGAPTYLTAGIDGYLHLDSSNDTTLELPAGTYTLTQVNRGSNANYREWAQPVTFTVLRVGMLRVVAKDQEFPNYAYVQTAPEGQAWDYLKLHVPNQELTTYTINASGDGGPFAFSATVDGTSLESFTLPSVQENSHSIVLPVGATFAVTQTTGGRVTKVAAADGATTPLETNAVRGKTFVEKVVSGGKTIHFYNYTPICKIVHDGQDQPFESLAQAIGYARSKMNGAATIEMLVDYDMPANDFVSLEEGDNITLTTATPKTNEIEFGYIGDGSFATLTRGSSTTTTPPFSVPAGATLALTNIAVKGDDLGEGSGPSVSLAKSSKLKLSGLVQIDGNPSDVGNLVLAGDATGEELEITDNLSEGSNVLVWGENTQMDGLSLYADEPFGVTTAPSSSSVSGLEYLKSQKGPSVTASAGDGNQVIWMAQPAVQIEFKVEGKFANREKKFSFRIDLPEGAQSITWKLDGVQQETPLSRSNNTFTLANGQTITLEGLRSNQSYVLTQTTSDNGPSDPGVTPAPIYGTESYNPTLSVPISAGSVGSESPSVHAHLQSNDARVLTLSSIRALPDAPATLTIINVYSIDGSLPTGIEENVGIWSAIVVVCGALVIVVLFRRRLVR
ncbi:MAG: SpaA isopeptide-forming pilin-related protein [Coriobacteriales bacterium]|nr:SpaA isopeptide-forming pilin-related protein [Coriobacteriales bacterium]